MGDVLETVSNDLQFIHELVSKFNLESRPDPEEDHDIESSDSEAEIELLVKEREPVLIDTADSDSDSESDSDAEPETDNDQAKTTGPTESTLIGDDADDEEDLQPVQKYVATANEVVDPAANIPEIESVDESEILERVGEIMSIVDRMVVVRGLPIPRVAPGNIRALDSDTLLVFGDRIVLGYIHETFGPTFQPMYQVKFQSADQIDKNRIKVSREVFHVPKRSRYILVTDTKGSDASNMNDEEPADHELDFSDDEAEQAYRQLIKRSKRTRATAFSRFGSPTPSQLRDEDLVYDPYTDMQPGPSRPSPIAYDIDPYADNPVEDWTRGSVEGEDRRQEVPRVPDGSPQRNGRPRERHSRGSGRGRARGRFSRLERLPPQSRPQPPPQAPIPMQGSMHVPLAHPSFSPPPYPSPYNGNSYPGNVVHPSFAPYQAQQPPANVVPHINPRFVSSFGFSLLPQNMAPPAPPHHSPGHPPFYHPPPSA